VDRALGGRVVAEARRFDFAAREGQTLLVPGCAGIAARQVLVVGTADGNGARPWYRVADTAVARARDLLATRVAIVAPAGAQLAGAVTVLAEGCQLSSYAFTALKSTTPKQLPLEIVLVVPRVDARTRGHLQRGCLAAAATCYARDLTNLPADTATPRYLASEARKIARQQKLQTRILDERGIRAAGMGALAGVARGSSQPPRFIELVYRPRGARKTIALAGKGVTFDSGGLSLKHAQAMEAQKRDMAGGAAVLAVMSVIRDLSPAAEVRAYVPATENMPGGRAIKPGDVVRAYNGKTIEVLNTDAEGRLVLADAMSRAVAGKPDLLIDLATLTGAVRMALGTRYAAIMGTNAALVRALISAAEECDERLWELPLVAEYRSDIDSAVADIKNTGAGGASTIIGGLFLREFAGHVPWAHIDFSSTVVAEKPFPCHPRGATGFGVRTVLRYLQRFA
jgi:leucyl aminopeptidase